MPRCPITYDEIAPDLRYSRRGLTALSRKLETLLPFPYNLEEQLQLASEMAAKISIQGVQPKVSVALQVETGTFVAVEKGGRFIIKPQNPMFSHLPENEDLTMKLASLAGLDVPLHGLAWARDGTLFYFIKRFDRLERGGKLAVEDFAQLAGLSRDTKYAYSIEKLITLIDTYMTFPVIEKAKFFRLFLFNFLTGNEDAHLKNYSVIDLDGKRQLSPCYDLLNSTLVLSGGDPEESALPLGGKKRNLTRNDMFRYLARERLGLTGKVIDSTAEALREALPLWEKTIEISFLPQEQKEQYRDIVIRRAERVFGR
jgi:serine/threonine-protein kinase HipA